jgi:hypothetical protein
MFGGLGRSLREPDAGCRVKQILATYTKHLLFCTREIHGVFPFEIENDNRSPSRHYHFGKSKCSTPLQ